ncbi:MAG: hypothetical protein ACXWV8_00535 [Chitinophagaceae bacterium]
MRTTTTIRKSVCAFILFTGLLTGAVSCKKEKKNGPEPTPAAERIKEFKTGDEFIRFDYKTDGAVNKVTINSDVNTGGTIMTYTVNYDAAKKITSLETAGEKIVPVYENNLLARADILQDNERVGYTTYQFDGGLIKRATIYFGEGNDFQPILEFNFAYNQAGNIIETVALITDGEPGHMERSGHINYQYDQKINPLYAQRELLALFWQGVSKNNIKVEDHFDANLQPEDKFVYDYQYNNNGLPKSAIVTKGLPGQSTTTSNLNFTYQ